MNEASAILLSSVTEECCSSVASALARDQFHCLERWLYSTKAGSLGLCGVERGGERRGRELLRLLLQAHLGFRGDGDVGEALRVSAQDSSDGEVVLLYTLKRMHTRSIVTIFGEVWVKRVGYGKAGTASIHPLDEQLQLPGRTYSYELQRRLVKKAVQGPFDEAIDVLHESTGVEVPKRSAEEIVIDASRDFDSFYADRQAEGGDGSGSILVGSVDCKGIPMVKSELVAKCVRRGKGKKAQKKRMATVAAVFTQMPYIRTPEEVVASLFDLEKTTGKKRNKASGPERKRVWASLQAGKDAFIKDVYEEMKRRDPHGRKLHVMVTDGERALQKRILRTMKGSILILDLLHVLERLWGAGHAFYGEGTKEAEEFVHYRALRLLRGEVSQVVKGLRQMVTKRKLRGKKKKKVLDAASYYYKNKSRMRYDEYLAQGLPIASGSVEGACKNLIKDRMERSGMRWTARMAEAMVKMRAIYLSGDYDDYWDYHVIQDQDRLYPKNRWKPACAVVQE